MPVAVGEVITAAQLNGLPVRIADITLGADAATMDFQSIPAIYAHLFLECYLRGDTAAAVGNAVIRFNNDSAANYDYQYVVGNAAAATAAETFAQGSALIGNMPQNTAGANLFGSITIDIPHYANTANNKAAISRWAHKSGVTTGLLRSGRHGHFWRSNAAITQITLSTSAANFVAGSRVDLYGLA